MGDHYGRHEIEAWEKQGLYTKPSQNSSSSTLKDFVLKSAEDRMIIRYERGKWFLYRNKDTLVWKRWASNPGALLDHVYASRDFRQ